MANLYLPYQLSKSLDDNVQSIIDPHAPTSSWTSSTAQMKLVISVDNLATAAGYMLASKTAMNDSESSTM